MSNEERLQPAGDAGHPHRRHTLWMKIAADDVDSLIAELRHVQTELMRGNMSQSSISGGYSTGHIIVHSFDGNMDHDTWAKELDEWLVARDREKAKAPEAA